MKINCSLSCIILYTLLLFSHLSFSNSKSTKKREEGEGNEDIFPTVDKNNLMVYQVAQSLSVLAHSFQEKIRILQKWYHLIHQDANPSKEYEEFLSQFNSNEVEKKNKEEEYEYPTEIKIRPNANFNPFFHDQDISSSIRSVKSGKESMEKSMRNEVDDDDDELDINRYHYSVPNQMLSNNKVSFEENQFSESKIFKRDTACNSYGYCESQCLYYEGKPMVIRSKYAPMYNCSGRFLTNFYDKNKLPLSECDTCSPKNTTCLNWCCQLMDTSVNDDIPEFVTVEKMVNETLVSTTVENPDLTKVCYCPFDRYGNSCQNFYPARCNLTLVTPTDECFDENGEQVRGLKYMDSAYNCPLYNYTDIIHLSYHLICEQIPSAAYNLSVTCNNYTFYGEEGYIINQPPLYASRVFQAMQVYTRIWNFNHLGSSTELIQTIDNAHLVGNKTIDVDVDLGMLYTPDDKMKSVFNGGRVLIETGFVYNYKLMGSAQPKPSLTYVNIGNYFKNTDFFDKEVIFKTIKQILSIVIPAVVGGVVLFAIFVVIIYILYRKTRPMKVSC